MRLALILLIPLVVVEDSGGDQSNDGASTPLERRFLDDAREYQINRDAGSRPEAVLRRQPVYLWTNPVRLQQRGAVFIWTCRGRAEAVGCIFSAVRNSQIIITHELHSLSLSPLDVTRTGSHADTWHPSVPGLVLAPLEGAAPPAASASVRLVQLRALSREFGAISHDGKGERWELRLLPHPVYRYESTDPDVLDGALFAFVTTAGTDPELFLVIEARKAVPGGLPTWEFGAARFTDLSLSVHRKGVEVFKAARLKGNALQVYPGQEYRLFKDRYLSGEEQKTP